MTSELVARIRAGDERAVARGLSLIEAGGTEGQALLQQLRSAEHSSTLIGVTGTPGSGKSTLVDRLVGQARERDQRIAVLAIDPSSPFSGGAILEAEFSFPHRSHDPAR